MTPNKMIGMVHVRKWEKRNGIIFDWQKGEWSGNIETFLAAFNSLNSNIKLAKCK